MIMSNVETGRVLENKLWLLVSSLIMPDGERRRWVEVGFKTPGICRHTLSLSQGLNDPG